MCKSYMTVPDNSIFSFKSNGMDWVTILVIIVGVVGLIVLIDFFIENRRLNKKLKKKQKEIERLDKINKELNDNSE